MGRPSGTKNQMRSSEEKETLILEYLNGNEGYQSYAKKNNINASLFHVWLVKYRRCGLEGLKSNTGTKSGVGTGRPKAHISEEEKLKCKIIKLEIEVARLKKGYQVKGVGAQKEYVTTPDVNMK